MPEVCLVFHVHLKHLSNSLTVFDPTIVVLVPCKCMNLRNAKARLRKWQIELHPFLPLLHRAEHVSGRSKVACRSAAVRVRVTFRIQNDDRNLIIMLALTELSTMS